MEDVFTSFIKLKSDFNFTTQQFKEIFLLPHLVALRSYVKAFQYKLIDSVLYTNSKLCKIGFKINDACTFWECVSLCLWMPSLQNVLDWFRIVRVPSIESANPSLRTKRLFGILSKQCPLSSLLNYFIVVGNYFCGTAEEAKHFLKFKDCNQNLRLNMKLKKISTIKPSLKRNRCSLHHNYSWPSSFNASFLFWLGMYRVFFCCSL